MLEKTAISGLIKRLCEYSPCPSSYLVDGGFLYEPGGLCWEQAVCRHDVDLIGPSLFQNLSRRHKVLHVVYDVILREGNDKGGRLLASR